jgi:hypothetical protein
MMSPPKIIFSLARQRLLKFEPDDTKRLFRQHRPKSDIGPGRTAAHDAAMMDI